MNGRLAILILFFFTGELIDLAVMRFRVLTGRVLAGVLSLPLINVFLFVHKFLLVPEVLGEVMVTYLKTHLIVAFGGLAGG